MRALKLAVTDEKKDDVHVVPERENDCSFILSRHENIVLKIIPMSKRKCNVLTREKERNICFRVFHAHFCSLA